MLLCASRHIQIMVYLASITNTFVFFLVYPICGIICLLHENEMDWCFIYVDVSSVDSM